MQHGVLSTPGALFLPSKRLVEKAGCMIVASFGFVYGEGKSSFASTTYFYVGSIGLCRTQRCWCRENSRVCVEAEAPIVFYYIPLI